MSVGIGRICPDYACIVSLDGLFTRMCHSFKKSVCSEEALLPQYVARW